MFAIRQRLFINSILRKHDLLFFAVMRMRKKFVDIIINDDTEIVIEGYPRSANTYAVAAFQYAQDRPVCVARHTHAIAQLKKAVEKKLPILVVIRTPDEAILSYKIRESSLTIRSAIKQYRDYYKFVKKYRQHICVIDFEQVIEDFNIAIDKINDKYGTCFRKYEKSHEAECKIIELVENMERLESGGELRETHVARPSEKRKALKVRYKEDLFDKENASLMDECIRLYNELRR